MNIKINDKVNYIPAIEETKQEIASTVILRNGIDKVVSCMAKHKTGYSFYDYKRGFRANEVGKRHMSKIEIQARNMFKTVVVA